MEELDLKELFEIFWNKKVQILLIILIFIVIGIIYTVGFTTPMYSSSTSLVLVGTSNSTDTTGTSGQTSEITTTDITINSKLVATYSVLVKTKNILGQVISNLGIDVDEDELKKNIEVTAKEDTELIEITVENENPVYAAKIANETAKVFKEKIAGEIYKINNVYIVDEAQVESTPSNINHTKDVAIFGIVGLIIAVMYVLIANMLDTTVKTQEDIEKNIKIPVIASIPVYDVDSEKTERKGGRR